MEKAARMMHAEQGDLEKIMQKYPTPPTTAPGAEASDNQNSDWPTHMPEIKGNLNTRRESLQPISSSERKAHHKKKTTPPGHGHTYHFEPQRTSSVPSGPKEVNPFEEHFSKATRLPAIGKVPSIKIDASPHPRRDPHKEKHVIDARSLTSPDTPVPPSGLINFDHLERPGSGSPAETFMNVPDALQNIPNVLDKMPDNTFDAIPSDVFDAIPRAVSARHEEKIKRYQSEQKVASVAGGLNKSAGPLGGTNGARRHTVAVGETPTYKQSDGKPLTGQGAVGAVSLITALFPNAGTSVRSHQDQMESDFMFALFIQEQEQASCKSPNKPPSTPNTLEPTTPTGSVSNSLVTLPMTNNEINPPNPAQMMPATRQHGGSRIRPISLPAPPSNQEDEEVGHFCAPFCPGFCEANHCIFHTKNNNEPSLTPTAPPPSHLAPIMAPSAPKVAD